MNLKACETITKLNQKSQNQKLKLFAKVNFETKLKILTSQKQLFHKLKNNNSNVDNTILTLSSLILAIDSIAKELDDVNFNVIKLKSKNNNKTKREKLLSYWGIVRTLKLEQKMSFRDIATYFRKYHKFEVSYSTIFKVWNELENNILNKDN